MKPPSTFSLVWLGLVVTLVLGACNQATPIELNLAPASELPAFVDRSAPLVKDAYRFAIANPEILSTVPCYCGCGALGHQNNLQCYIKEFRADGAIEFETHGFG